MTNTSFYKEIVVVLSIFGIINTKIKTLGEDKQKVYTLETLAGDPGYCILGHNLLGYLVTSLNHFLLAHVKTL